MRFFIVDDDKATRVMLRKIIEKAQLGEVVGEAEDGIFVTTEILRNNEVDVLLTDFLMPRKDGIRLVTELKPFFHGGIVMLSQEKAKAIVGAAYAAGVDYYINKPINHVEIISVLENVMQYLTMRKITEAIA